MFLTSFCDELYPDLSPEARDQYERILGPIWLYEFAQSAIGTKRAEEAIALLRQENPGSQIGAYLPQFATVPGLTLPPVNLPSFASFSSGKPGQMGQMTANLQPGSAIPANRANLPLPGKFATGGFPVVDRQQRVEYGHVPLWPPQRPTTRTP
ncbi:hypothetical protein BDV93DRAFT_587875 [Ceratobasidium sp. AG-I]|nr:hypothetical protein BDV93DRAFT_587875 [Ceratobasidium sp. AG-I]